MSDLLNYIKSQKNKGLDDYTILQSTVNMSKNNNIRNHKKILYKKKSMIGGKFTLTADDKAKINAALAEIDESNEAYGIFKAAVDDTEAHELEGYDNIDNVLEKIKSLPKKTPAVVNTDLPEDKTADATDDATDDASADATANTSAGTMADADNMNQNNNIYVTLNPGDVLYFPTETIKDFDENMMFVDVTEVLDQSVQRSFTMFFTDDKAYAKRFAGIWSLNKRLVYLHKLVVKEGRPITRIKRFSSKIISDKVKNITLGHNLCGLGIDGTIHGIKIEASFNKKTVAEYYICNPSEYFTRETTFPSTVDNDDRLDEEEPIEQQSIDNNDITADTTQKTEQPEQTEQTEQTEQPE